jgi:hypothetical protein
MCFNPSPVRRVPSPNRYMAVAKFCFCKNNKRLIDCCLQGRGQRSAARILRGLRVRQAARVLVGRGAQRCPRPCRTRRTRRILDRHSSAGRADKLARSKCTHAHPGTGSHTVCRNSSHTGGTPPHTSQASRLPPQGLTAQRPRGPQDTCTHAKMTPQHALHTT